LIDGCFTPRQRVMATLRRVKTIKGTYTVAYMQYIKQPKYRLNRNCRHSGTKNWKSNARSTFLCSSEDL